MTPEARHVMIVRHPQTERNKAGCYIGRSDSPLTALGHAQVRWLKEVVTAWEPEATYTSPLGRAKDAARAITPANAGFHVLEDLQEIDFGQAEGHTYKELVARGMLLDYQSGGPVAPGGERLSAFHERVRAVGATISTDGRRVLVVTHGGVMRHLLTHLLGLPFSTAWRFGVPNAAVAVVRLAEGEGVLEGLTAPPSEQPGRRGARATPWL